MPAQLSFLAKRVPRILLYLITISSDCLDITLSKALHWCILITHKEHFNKYHGVAVWNQTEYVYIPLFALAFPKCRISLYICMKAHLFFAYFLKASKAFDLVNHNILFSRLLSNGFPAHLIGSFSHGTRNKINYVCLVGSSCFLRQLLCGKMVCQGGVVSPILFTLYIDDLLLGLKDEGVGYFLEQFLFADTLCYADGLILLAPSPSYDSLLWRLCCQT